MAATSGKASKITYNDIKISGVSKWSMSGYELSALDASEFGHEIGAYVAGGFTDMGDISFSGYYDPDNLDGQVTFSNACKNGISIRTLKFYTTITRFLAVGVNGDILPISCDSIEFGKNNLGSIKFVGKISGGPFLAFEEYSRITESGDARITEDGNVITTITEALN